MNRSSLVAHIKKLQSCLCIGLDPDLSKFPEHLLLQENPIFAFNKAIIDATKDYCVAYKPNTAFYEAHGIQGWQALMDTIHYIPKDKFIIADAKRGDIGNTSTQYAKAFFEHMPCDAITVAPYMGEDSVKPFLEFPGKWAIVLGLTSNAGSKDFQLLTTGDERLYEKVLKTVASWGTPDNTMFVIGATQTQYLENVRNILPNHFLLIPGVGAQGGSLEDVMRIGMNADCGLLINSSREIIYAAKDENFAQAAAAKAKAMQAAMSKFIS